MGATSRSILALNLKGMPLENGSTYKNSNVSLRQGRILKKRRASLGRSRRPIKGIEERVQTLKRLIPNGESKGKGLDGLFNVAADYILRLQMKVKAMQVMVQLLSQDEG